MKQPKLFPAVDLLEGRCVRLFRGDYSRETVYSGNPVEQALKFEKEGAPWLHVVDLDAARSVGGNNRSVVIDIAAASSIPVQTGGGIRSTDDARMLFDAGITRVVLGTAAIANPTLVDDVARYGRVAVGVDVRVRKVATNGWTSVSEISFSEALHIFSETGAEALVVTQIESDGTLMGADLELYREALDLTDLPVITSGGVGSLADLKALAALSVEDRGPAGIIVGRALYEGTFTVPEAITAVSLDRRRQG